MALFGRSKREQIPADNTPLSDVAESQTDTTTLRGVAEYRDFLLSHAPASHPFGIGLLELNGLTLCEELRSDIDLPFYTASLVDGYAVRTSNLVGAATQHPIILPVIASVADDGYAATPLAPGAAVRVAINAPVPEGADAVVSLAEVVEVSNAEGGLEAVRFTQEAAFGQNLRQAGSRVADQDLLLEPGTIFTPRNVAILAEVGLDKVLARPRPRVVVASVSNGFVEPGQPLTRLNQSYDAITALLAACAKADGGQVFPIGILDPAPAALKNKLNEQLVRADLIVVASDLDLSLAISQLGNYDAAPVAMLPGSPRLFATIGSDQTPVVVVPSDAVAAFVNYLVFVRPLIRSLSGQDPLAIDVIETSTHEAIAADPERTQFILGVKSESGVQPLQLLADAGAIELARANVLIVVPPQADISANQNVTCWPLDL